MLEFSVFWEDPVPLSPNQCEAVLLNLLDELRRVDSWCSETHLHKASYFLEAALHVPLDLKFQLYLYGPFSFELRRSVASMLGDGFVTLAQNPPFGPKIEVTPHGREFAERYLKQTAKYNPQVRYVAESLGRENVHDLEKIATALMVKLELPGEDEQRLVKRICKVKPHVSPEDAHEALTVAKRILDQAPPIAH